MTATTIRRKVVEVADSLRVLEEGMDYKDVAYLTHDSICNVLSGHPRLAPLFQDMPDADCCPRSFGEWMGSVCSGQ